MADQLSKTLQKEENTKAPEIMNLQLQQLTSQTGLLRKDMCLFLMIKEVFASITKCLAISNKIVENLNDSRNKKTGPPQDEQGCSLRIQRGLFAFLTNT